MTHSVPDGGETDWKGLSVIALATSAVAIPIITGRILGDHLSDPGGNTTYWACIGVSAVLATVAIVRSIRIVRSPGTRHGMAWVGLVLSLPLLLFAVVAGIGTLVLWLLLRNMTF